MTVVPTQVTFRGLAHSDALEAEARERVKWLQQFFDGITSCHVRLEVPHRHRRDCGQFEALVEIGVRGGDPIAVTASHPHGSAALRDAFEIARRQVQDFAREQRGFVKAHGAAPG
jgi:ribosome-associated translation inhibitor RaiA